jgi:DNA modification methylase
MRTARILVGDVRTRLRELPEASVQCVVTSPPYWGLRDYGHAEQIGMELTPKAYVAALVETFTEIRRVLKPDGTTWLNLGDCYANDGKWGGETGGKQAYLGDADRKSVGREKRLTGLKPKDLVGIPWTVAFALRDAGWYLRCDVVWHKPNGLPESVVDRPAKNHEFVFLLTRSARYFYDHEAVKEPYAESTLRELTRRYDGTARKDYAAAGVQNPSEVKRRIVESAQKNQAVRDRRRAGVNDWDNPNRKGVQATGPMPLHSLGKQNGRHEPVFDPGGRNRRSVWSIHTQPFPDAHFAVMPEGVAEPCILAGSRIDDVVLDPFCGSGTTGVVACRHNRHFIGIELNPAYAALAEKRIRGDAALLNQVEVCA